MKEIVVAVWLSDNAGKGGIYNFSMSRKPYPPEAYKKRKDVLERN